MLLLVVLREMRSWVQAWGAKSSFRSVPRAWAGSTRGIAVSAESPVCTGAVVDTGGALKTPSRFFFLLAENSVLDSW